MPIPTHVSTELDAADRGWALGHTWRTELQASFTGYAELFDAVGASRGQVREWGEQAVRRTAEWAPRLAVEIAAMAEGAGLARWQLGALNARTEVLAAAAHLGEGDCSTSVVLPGNVVAPRTVQTWDWHDVLRDGMLIHSFQPRPGHQVRTFTEFGVVGKIGVNSAGLGLHFNVLRHDSDHDRIGVPVHVVARRILDEATSVEAAVELARSARLSASSVLTVVTFDGQRSAASALELCPDGVAEIPADDTGTLLHTNHFLDPKLAEGERTTPEVSTTDQRLASLRERADELREADRTQRAHALRAVCAHPDPELPPHQRWQTLATISLDLADHRLHVHPGGPCGVAATTWQSA
ncbi:C45 family autoproteolytic acyltransferase/hydolase [Saccharopolyspora sp. 5N708]|uniref:C45 family autoproteolytic acyltransferase/hydolase n=1 Tax=Saccharopolyspora sp. 5N708 TaxID=3457424 RepID=UPI003FD4B3AB